MQEATTFNIFYDDISFHHLATALISVFTLYYGPGLLFRGPLCISQRRSSLYWDVTQRRLTDVSEHIGPTFKGQAIQTAVQRQALWHIAVNSLFP